MLLKQKCQLGSARTTGQFFYCWLFERMKPTPLLLHAKDGSQNWCNFKPSFSPTVLDFYHNSKISQIAFLPFLFGLFPCHPHLKIMSYPESAALDGQVNLCSWPWGQLSHIHFPPLCKKPFRASTSPVAAGWVRLWVAGGWAHHLSHCPAHSSSCWTVTCRVKSEFSSNIILQLFSPWEILSIAPLNAFHLCLEIWLCWFLTLQ